MSHDATTARQTEETSVYRYYDAIGVLIYVGITGRGAARNWEHSRNAEWWSFVARQEVEHHATLRAALDREKRLIQEFRPPFNVLHNHDAASLKSAYVALQAGLTGDPAKDIHSVVRDMNRRLPLHQVSRDSKLLRTSPLHAHVVARLRLPDRGVPVVGSKNWGSVVASEFNAPYLLIRAERLPEMVTGIRAVLKWVPNFKPPTLWIPRIIVDDDFNAALLPPG